MALFINRGRQHLEKDLISIGKTIESHCSSKPAHGKASPSPGLQLPVIYYHGKNSHLIKARIARKAPPPNPSVTRPTLGLSWV